MSLASLNSEAIQLLILAELNKAEINDTRQLNLGNGQLAGADGEAQLAIKGALDSLVAREVSNAGVQLDRLAFSEIAQTGGHRLRDRQTRPTHMITDLIWDC